VRFKVKDDPRVTRVGRVLRRYSLDELPQFIQALSGKMSIVGPRPALPAEIPEYEPDDHRRLMVRPGITGLWQVSGRSDLCWKESVRLDLYYVDNWSMTMDLRILVSTVKAVFSSQGAY
jgi:lipopolysaccharide/colanic/teichoic acid biosynthesis glycosyltransferase